MTAMTSGSASSDRIKVAVSEGRAAVNALGEGAATVARCNATRHGFGAAS